jgi:hypothetical protein
MVAEELFSHHFAAVVLAGVYHETISPFTARTSITRSVLCTADHRGINNA